MEQARLPTEIKLPAMMAIRVTLKLKAVPFVGQDKQDMTARLPFRIGRVVRITMLTRDEGHLINHRKFDKDILFVTLRSIDLGWSVGSYWVG